MIGEDTPESFYMEGMFALNNQYESMKTGRNVKSGLLQKAKAGGSYGGYRLGYVKAIEQLPDGRQVSGVAHDPQRADFVTAGFRLYATGEYSLSQLADELYDFGLRTFPTRRFAEGKVGTSALQRLLRNPYYAGKIVYKRGEIDEQVFDGRHEPLIDQETFERVQQLLDEKRVAGERRRCIRHYLRGSVFCSDCGKRLTYGVSTGNGGRYAYYFCSARINDTPCNQRTNMRPELIEQAIQRYYRAADELSAAEIKKRTRAIESMVGRQPASRPTGQAGQDRPDRPAQGPAVRLIRLHAEEGDEVSGDAFRDERARMQTENGLPNNPWPRLSSASASMPTPCGWRWS